MKSKNLLLSCIALAFLSVTVIFVTQGLKVQGKYHPKSTDSEEGIAGGRETGPDPLGRTWCRVAASCSSIEST